MRYLENSFSFLKSKVSKAIHNKSLVEGLAFSGFSFINRGFVFLLLLILASYISPAEYGYLNLFNTVVMVIGYFMALSTEGYFGISYFNKTGYDHKQVFTGIVSIALIMTVLLLVLLLIDGERISRLLSLPKNSLYIAMAVSLFAIFQNLNLDFFRLQKRVVHYGVFSCINALINFVLSIVLVKTFAYGWEGRIYAQLTSFFLFAVIAIVIFIHYGFFVKPSWDCIKKMVVWGVPLIPHNATNFLRQGCDRYIINGFHTIDDVGLFSFALNLANIIMMIGVGFNQSNSVDIYKVLSDDSLNNDDKAQILKKQRRDISSMYIIIAVLIVVAVIPSVPLLLPKYADSIKYFIPLSAYGLLQCFYFLYTNYLFYYQKTKLIMIVTVCSALLHLLLSLLFTRYSLYLTCVIYLLSQGIVCVLIRKFAKRELSKELSIKR